MAFADIMRTPEIKEPPQLPAGALERIKLIDPFLLPVDY